MALKIPPPFVESARSLLALTAADLDTLAGTIRDAPRPQTTAAFLEGVTAAFPDRAGEVGGILRMLISLQLAGVEDDLSAAQLAEQFAKAAHSLAPADKVEDAGFWSHLVAQLTQVFSAEQSLGLVVKAIEVLSESERMFADARVLTDLRPVFGPALDAGPQASVVIHTLRIDCTGEPNRFHVVLDAEDLRRLRDVLDRALEKEAALKKMGEDMKLPVLGYPRVEEADDATV
jgi:hypothetical protein